MAIHHGVTCPRDEWPCPIPSNQLPRIAASLILQCQGFLSATTYGLIVRTHIHLHGSHALYTKLPSTDWRMPWDRWTKFQCLKRDRKPPVALAAEQLPAASADSTQFISRYRRYKLRHCGIPYIVRR